MQFLICVIAQKDMITESCDRDLWSWRCLCCIPPGSLNQCNTFYRHILLCCALLSKNSGKKNTSVFRFVTAHLPAYPWGFLKNCLFILTSRRISLGCQECGCEPGMMMGELDFPPANQMSWVALLRWQSLKQPKAQIEIKLLNLSFLHQN